MPSRNIITNVQDGHSFPRVVEPRTLKVLGGDKKGLTQKTNITMDGGALRDAVAWTNNVYHTDHLIFSDI
jgi:hypothetical protein